MGLEVPFPYFGGKALVAHLVWQALGDVKHYIEPFFGSGAVLLARPNYDPTRHIETVNDADGYVANVWRALQNDPDEVARWCDWPVNHADLAARRRVLISREGYLLENLSADPDWYDAKLAGYWIWAASCWIGSGLTSKPCDPGARPNLADTGKGIHKLSKRGDKLGQIPHVINAGPGINKLSKRDCSDREGCDVRDPYNVNLYVWFRELSERLRYVRVVCGDWTRVCGGDWQDSEGTAGIFFDPPYGVEDRVDGLYHRDNKSVAAAVRQWCLERGNRPTYRIVLAGYDEHDELAMAGWRQMGWRANGGYANYGQRRKINRFRETLWFSPHCVEQQLLPLDLEV